MVYACCCVQQKPEGALAAWLTSAAGDSTLSLHQMSASQKLSRSLARNPDSLVMLASLLLRPVLALLLLLLLTLLSTWMKPASCV
jgi:hypothetical protein